MAVTVSLTEAQILTALRSFLLGILPAGTEVIRGQVNRVPQPAAADFVVMTPLSQVRLSTNRDVDADAALTGSIAGTVLTVTDVDFGTVRPGAPVYGAADGTTISVQLTGVDGGPGTYRISKPQTAAPGPLYAGTHAALQATQVTIQLDVHGPASGDNAVTISTLMRDEVACQAFTDAGFEVQPLYAGEPRQMPFINAEQQYENRWTIDAVLQANPIVSVPQQFAEVVTVSTISVP